jgi:hypothetical protein
MCDLKKHNSKTAVIKVYLVFLRICNVFGMLVILAFIAWPLGILIQVVWPAVAKSYNIGISVSCRSPLGLKKHDVMRRDIPVQLASHMEFLHR